MKTIIVATAVFLLAGCAGSKITNRWVNPVWQPAPQQRILVLSLVNHEDHNWDYKIESHITGDLADIGITSVSAYKQYGPHVISGKKESELETLIRDSSFSGVITVTLLDRKSEQVYVTPSPTRPNEETGVPFSKYVHSVTDKILSPGYYATTTQYFWETNYYQYPGGKLIYSVQSKSFDPNSTEEMAHQYGKLIVKDMLKQGVLKKQPVRSE